jgi:hypothetical protein
MDDAQRYRMNAAECLSAAERCGPGYRALTLIIAASRLTLARQQEAMDELSQFGAKHSPRCQSSCLSNFPAIRAAVRLLRFKGGK